MRNLICAVDGFSVSSRICSQPFVVTVGNAIILLYSISVCPKKVIENAVPSCFPVFKYPFQYRTYCLSLSGACPLKPSNPISMSGTENNTMDLKTSFVGTSLG